MVSKRQIAEVVLNRLNGGKINRDSKITLRQAMWAVSESRNWYMQNKLFQNYANFGEFDIPYDVISEFTEKSVKDEDRGKWYIPLNGKKVMSLHNGMGVLRVYEINNEGDDLVPGSYGSESLFHGLPSETVMGKPSYSLANDKLWLKNWDTENTFVLDLILNSHSIGDRDDFMISADMEFHITEMAFQKLAAQAQIPQDNIQDNIDGAK